MSLQHELTDLFGRIQDAPWPGEREAFDRFLRRRARRGRAGAAAAGLALIAVLGAGVLVARGQPEDHQTVAPPATPVQVPDEGFQVTVPTGWRVDQKLTGTVSGPLPGRPTGVVGSSSRQQRGNRARRRSPSGPTEATSSGMKRCGRDPSGEPTAGGTCYSPGPALGRSATT
jgi:Flp pilus assembly pilin Flp